MGINLVVQGFISADPELSYSKSGKPKTGVSVSYTPRRKHEKTGQWVDKGETVWVRAVWLGDQALFFVENLQKGQLVEIEGTPEISPYLDKAGGAKASLRIFQPSLKLIPRPSSKQQPTPQEAWKQPTQNAVNPWGAGIEALPHDIGG